MKTVYRHQVYMGTIGDLKTLEGHFARMALQGWMIDKIGVVTHRYRAVEPCQKRFFVDLLPQITAFDYPENEQAQDYRKLCEESGWTFIAASKQFHIFCAEDDAIPIHTDHQIQAQIYLKACRKYELPQYLFCALIFGFLLFSQLFYNGVEVFLSNILVFQMLGFAFFLVGYLWTAGFVWTWYRHTRKAARQNLPMPVANERLAQIRSRVFVAGLFAFLICMLTGITLEILGGTSASFLLIFMLPIAALGVGLWLRRQIDTRRRERKTNIRLFVVTLVVMELVFMGIMGVVVRQIITTRQTEDSLDNRPALTLQDLGIAQPSDMSAARVKGSVAVPVHYSYWETNSQGNIHTEVYRAVSKPLTRALYRRYVEDMRQGYRQRSGRKDAVTALSEAEAADWGADAGVIALGEEDAATELILMRGKTVLRLSLVAYGSSGMDTHRAQQATRATLHNPAIL